MLLTKAIQQLTPFWSVVEACPVGEREGDGRFAALLRGNHMNLGGPTAAASSGRPMAWEDCTTFEELRAGRHSLIRALPRPNRWIRRRHLGVARLLLEARLSSVQVPVRDLLTEVANDLISSRCIFCCASSKTAVENYPTLP